MRRIDGHDLTILNMILELDPALGEQVVGAIDRVRLALHGKPVPAATPIDPGRPMPTVEYRRPTAQAIVDGNGTGHEMIPEGQPLPRTEPKPTTPPAFDLPSDLSREEREIVQWFAVRGGAYPANMHARRSCEAQVNVQAKAFDQAWRNVKARGLIVGEGSGPAARFRFFKA